MGGGLFGRGASVFVVVHAESVPQVLRNLVRSHEAGADGAFLINHAISEAQLLDCYEAARPAWPQRWLGLSFMGRTAGDALDLLPDSASGLWTGNAGISMEAADPAQGARLFQEKRAGRSGWRGLHFGGVAFKHQEQVSDPAAAARLAQPYVDVVTTSGAATGVPAPLAKIAAMKAALGDHPLAVASGVTPENIGQYLGLVDCFLVATGISDSPTELNPARATDLVSIIRAGHIGEPVRQIDLS